MQIARLKELGEQYLIVLDNGPELTSKTMFFCAQKTAVRVCFIRLGKLT